MNKGEENRLVAKAKKGDLRAYEKLMMHCRGKIYAAIHALLLDSYQAEDVLHESFIKAWQQLPSFRSEARFSTWVYRIASNNALSRLRQEKTRKQYEAQTKFFGKDEIEKTQDGLNQLQSEERSQYIAAALKGLNAQDRLVVTMFYLKEYSVKEICEITGLEASNIKIKLHRSRNKLYEILQKLLRDEVKNLI